MCDIMCDTVTYVSYILMSYFINLTNNLRNKNELFNLVITYFLHIVRQIADKGTIYKIFKAFKYILV